MSGKTFKSAEHAYQYEKAVNQGQLRLAETIQSAKDAYEAKELSKSLKTTREWTEKKEEKMAEILRCKAEQVPEFAGKLLDTEEKLLVSAKPDRLWGSGLNPEDTLHTKKNFRPGKNRLGKLLKKLRTHLRDDEQVVKYKPRDPDSQLSPVRTRSNAAYFMDQSTDERSDVG